MDETDFAKLLIAPDEDQRTEEDAEDAAPDVEEAEEAAADESAAEDDADAEETPPEDADEEIVYEVKVNGETLEVTEDELLKGYSRNADYSRDKRALAEQRKALEAEIAQERQKLENERALIMQMSGADLQEPDWAKLREEDPLGFGEAYADFQLKKQAHQAKLVEHQQLQQQRQQEFMRLTASEAVKVFPEWEQDGGFQNDVPLLRETAVKHGFTLQEVNSATDYRMFTVMKKAALYDQMMNERKTAEKKVVKRVRKAPVKQTPEAPKGKAARRDADVEAKRRKLAKTGSIEDAVSLIFNG